MRHTRDLDAPAFDIDGARICEHHRDVALVPQNALQLELRSTARRAGVAVATW